MSEATASDVAQWMVDRIRANGCEYQEDVVQEIEDRFGTEWVCENEKGNPAIRPNVLAAFRKMHDGTIEWSKRGKSWSTI
jgi:hypothetical protein